MTRNAVSNRVVYAGNASASTFNLSVSGEPIYFRSHADVVIVERSVTGVDTVLTEGIHYDLAGGPVTGDEGEDYSVGVATRTAGALATGAYWSVRRSSSVSQETDFELTADWNSSRHTVTNTFDRVIEIMQEVNDKADRALKLDLFDVKYDAGSKRISNMADGSSPQDAITYAQFQTVIVDAISVFDISGLPVLTNVDVLNDRIVIYDVSAAQHKSVAPASLGYFTGVTAGVTDNAIVRFDGTSGSLAQNSGILIDDSNVLSPATNGGGALGSTSLGWSSAFYASGAVLNFNAGDVTITHATNALAFAGASSGYTFDATISPAANDGAALGTTSLRFSDLFGATGFILNFNSDWIATHTAGILTVGTGDLRVTTAGTNSVSVVTVGGTQTLTNKTFSSPTFTGTVNFSDTAFTLQDDGDATKQARFQLSGLTTATTRTYTLPDVTDTLVTLTATQTLTNKSIAYTQLTGLGTGVSTALGVNIGSAGAPVLFNGAGGTPSTLTLTNATGLPVATGISGLGTGVATALAVNVGSAGAFVTFNGALGTPSSGTLTNATGLPISTGVSGLAAGIAAFLATPSSANLATALTDETGTAGSVVFSVSPALTGTPTSPTATNGTNTTQIATTAYVLATRLDQFTAPTASVSLNSQKITNLLDPTAAQDAATKNYVDTVAQGLDAKASVRVATTANGTLATAFANGQTVDGVTLVTGNRILLKSQTTQAENGIYTVNASGAPTRATDMDSWTEVPGAFVFVEEGTTNGNTGWTCTSDTGGTIGSTAMTWVQFSGAGTYTNGTGLTLTGTVFAIDSTVVTLTGSQTLTNKTLTAPIISTISNTGTITLPTATTTLVGRDTTDTLTNKTINLTGNTLTGTTAQFNTALSDGDFATLAGTETITSKTINLASNTLTGTTAQFNTALSDGDFATLAGTETLTNKTISIQDGNLSITGSADATKVLKFEVDGFTTATTRTITVPDITDTLVTLTATQTLTNKSIAYTQLTGLGTGVSTALGVNIGSAGAFVTFNGALGTPSSGTLTNATGLPISTGLTGAGTGVLTALGVNVGSAGAFVTFNGALGTPSSGTLTNATGLPISTGVSGLGANVATMLATFSSANIATACADETGSGALVFGTSPTISGAVLTGTTDIQQALTLSGDISPTQISANTNDYAPTGFATATVLRLSTDASRDLTGIAGGADGRTIVIHNVGSFDLVLKDGSGSSTAANRFQFGADVTLGSRASILLRYDATDSRWYRIADTIAGTGGGGGGAPDSAQYIVAASDATLSAERVATDTTTISWDFGTGGQAKANFLNIFTGNLLPSTDDGAALGSTSFKVSDAFFASGAVLNFNNGDVTLTHSSDTLTMAGGALVLGTALAVTSGGTGSTNGAGARAALGFGTTGEGNVFGSAINAGLSASVAGNALTIALKGADGNDPSATNPVLVPFRNATATTGTPSWLSVTAASSIVVSSGSTLGASNSVQFVIWIVGFNDAGTFRLGVINPTSATDLSTAALASSTAEGGAGAADNANTFYTGTAVTSKPYCILGYVEYSSGLATVGTYGSAPTQTQLFGGGITFPQKATTVQTFTASGTWTRPAGCTYIKVTVIGAGGGGGGGLGAASNSGMGGGGGGGGITYYYGSALNLANQTVTIGAGGTAGSGTGPTNGGNGGASSFGSLADANGGGGGIKGGASATAAGVEGGAGAAVGTNGTLKFGGQPGFPTVRHSGTQGTSGTGGNGPLGGGGGRARSSTSGASAGIAGSAYGAGGSGGYSLTTTGQAGGDGSDGVVIVEEFYN